MLWKTVVTILFLNTLKMSLSYGFFTKRMTNKLATLANARQLTTTVKVSSYNVLSSNLCEPNYFQSCLPEHLDPKYRLKVLKQKLDSEVEAKSVICLQEVSQNWNGSLHSYFSTKGYHLITAPYGNKFDGYMGVSIAVPLTEYDISNVDITRIADTKRLPKQPRSTGLNKAVETFQKIIRSVGRILGTYKDVPELWDSVTFRHNQMISLRLKSKHTDKSFVVGTYHMPCMFKMPSVMMVHCALSAQHLERFAGSDPYVLAGDFNIKPDSNMYRLMTEGTVQTSNPDFPVVQSGDNWTPTLTPLRSAYAICNGKEPDFTNYAKIQDQEPFIDTLDYIFLSKEWSVDSVVSLPHRSEVVGPLPNEVEPSDHILLSAALTLPEDPPVLVSDVVVEISS